MPYINNNLVYTGLLHKIRVVIKGVFGKKTKTRFTFLL